MGTSTMRIAEKERVVAELAGRVRDAKCLYVTDFTGLGVGAMTELRRRLAEAQVEYIVVKNTLARRALAGGDFEELTVHLEGPSAFAVSHSDAVVAAKILTEFARDREKPKIRAGLIDGKVVSMDDIRRIAALPPRDVLLAQLLGSVRAPIAGLVYTLHGLLAKFVRTVDAVRAQREAEGGAGASQPESVAPQPESVAPQPESVAPQAESVAPQADDPSSVESEA